jgi:predicted acyltransferase
VSVETVARAARTAVASAPQGVKRLSSLDAFRGATIAAMVIVNNPGTWSAMYWPLEHAEWNGWTPTDLIFPFFLAIVGVSLTLSRRTLTASTWRIVERGAIIIGCGLFMAGFPFFRPSHWRIPGVLFRIGLCYLAAAFAYRWTAGRVGRAGRVGQVGQVSQVAALSTAVVVILLAYWFVLTRFGDLSQEGNIGAAIDRAVFGHHLWRERWDPEGLLSTVPAVATTLLGVLGGMWLKTTDRLTTKIAGLALAGFALFAAGEAWGLVFPINKQLWTSSYVLLTAGAAAIVLAAFMYLMEVRRWTRWNEPFVTIGQNAITVFVVSGLVAKSMILLKVGGESLQTVVYERGFAWMGSPKNASLAFSIAFLAAMYVLCELMRRRGIFLKA